MRRKGKGLRKRLYLITSREKAPLLLLGWTVRSEGAASSCKAVGVNILVTVRPSLPLQEPVRSVPHMMAQLAPG